MTRAHHLLRVGALALPLILTAALPGCVAAFDVEPTVIDDLPPEPLVEEVPEAPGVAYVWVPGYWYWSGSSYVWVSGRYAVPPAPGHVYVRSGWVSVDGRYRFVRGYWAAPGYRPHWRYVYTVPPRRVGPVYRSYPRRR